MPPLYRAPLSPTDLPGENCRVHQFCLGELEGEHAQGLGVVDRGPGPPLNQSVIAAEAGNGQLSPHRPPEAELERQPRAADHQDEQDQQRQLRRIGSGPTGDRKAALAVPAPAALHHPAEAQTPA